MLHQQHGTEEGNLGDNLFKWLGLALLVSILPGTAPAMAVPSGMVNAILIAQSAVYGASLAIVGATW